MKRISQAHARIMWSHGIRSTDQVFIASFFSLYWGSWGALAGTERLQATAFPFGAGVPATKKRIEDTYGGICVDSGSTGEMAPWMTNSECEYRTGMHLWQDIVYAEVLNPETKEPVPYGQEGALVYTHLERDSQPMIRFWAGDIAKWVNSPCPCGLTYPRLPNGIYGRTDDMIVVRGENVYPSAIENCIRSVDELGDEFRILVRRQREMDELIVQAEYEPGMNSARIPEIKERLAQTMKAKGLRTIIELKEPNTFQRTEFKAKRVIDERDLGE